jgi:soluble P-type ATPase
MDAEKTIEKLKNFTVRVYMKSGNRFDHIIKAASSEEVHKHMSDKIIKSDWISGFGSETFRTSEVESFSVKEGF